MNSNMMENLTDNVCNEPAYGTLFLAVKSLWADASAGSCCETRRRSHRGEQQGGGGAQRQESRRDAHRLRGGDLHRRGRPSSSRTLAGRCASSGAPSSTTPPKSATSSSDRIAMSSSTSWGTAARRASRIKNALPLDPGRRGASLEDHPEINMETHPSVTDLNDLMGDKPKTPLSSPGESQWGRARFKSGGRFADISRSAPARRIPPRSTESSEARLCYFKSYPEGTIRGPERRAGVRHTSTASSEAGAFVTRPPRPPPPPRRASLAPRPGARLRRRRDHNSTRPTVRGRDDNDTPPALSTIDLAILSSGFPPSIRARASPTSAAAAAARRGFTPPGGCPAPPHPPSPPSPWSPPPRRSRSCEGRRPAASFGRGDERRR